MHITSVSLITIISYFVFPQIIYSRKPLRSDAARWDEFKTPSGRFIVPVVVDRRDKKSVKEQLKTDMKQISQ